MDMRAGAWKPHLIDSRRRTILSLGLSVAIHLIILIGLSYLNFFGDDFELLEFALERRPIEIREIKTEDFERFRRAGVDEAKTQDSVFIEEPIEIGHEDTAQEETESDQALPPQESIGELSLKSLGLDPDDKVIVKEPPKPQESSQEARPVQEKRKAGDLVVKRDPTLEVPFIDRASALDQMGLKSDILQRMGRGPGVDVARRGNMFMRLEPPEGLSPDELNTIEKIFYGFQVRVFENYIRALILSYNDLAPRKPQLQESLRRNNYTLSGRVTFDREGNVVAIRITRWTNHSDVQELFESSLQKINKIPNIPKDLIGERDEFNIYYILQIN